MAKPELPHGYLGPQPKFAEFGLSTIDHKEPEITSKTNQIEVKIQLSKPTKLTATLTHCAKSEELPANVFSQVRGNVVTFYASLPEKGYYKLQLFGLPLPDESKTLPGVYNYLINCTNVDGPVVGYPKQFSQWKEGCYINSPISLSKDSPLNAAKFEAFIPKAKSVAVVAEGEWTQLTKDSGSMWAGTVDLEKFRGKNSKVTLNANYNDDNKYSTLLEYWV